MCIPIEAGVLILDFFTETWPGTSSYGFISKLDSSLVSPTASGFLLLACLLCPSRLLADIVYVSRYHNTKGLVKAEVVSSNVALHLLIPTNY